MVSVRGTGLPPGRYTLGMGIPNSDGGFFSGYEIPNVAEDGTLQATFAMPHLIEPVCLVVAALSDDAGFHAPAFVAAGNVVQPGRCELLPSPPRPRGAFQFTMVPAPPGAGSTVEVFGRVPTLPEGIPSQAGWVSARLMFGNEEVTFSEATITVDASRMVRARFLLPENPRLHGRCVELTVVPMSFQDYLYGRFDYP